MRARQSWTDENSVRLDRAAAMPCFLIRVVAESAAPFSTALAARRRSRQKRQARVFAANADAYPHRSFK